MTPRQTLAPMEPIAARTRLWAWSPPPRCRVCGAVVPRDPLEPRWRLCRRHAAAAIVSGTIQFSDAIVTANGTVGDWVEPTAHHEMELAGVGVGR